MHFQEILLESTNTVLLHCWKRKNDFQLGKETYLRGSSNWDGSHLRSEQDLNTRSGKNRKGHRVLFNKYLLVIGSFIIFWRGRASSNHLLFSVLWGKQTSWFLPSLAAVAREGAVVFCKVWELPSPRSCTPQVAPEKENTFIHFHHNSSVLTPLVNLPYLKCQFTTGL